MPGKSISLKNYITFYFGSGSTSEAPRVSQMKKQNFKIYTSFVIFSNNEIFENSNIVFTKMVIHVHLLSVLNRKV